MLKRVNIVVFDFDGTISASDTNYEFGRWCFKHDWRTWPYLPLVGLFSLGRFIDRDGIWWRQMCRRFTTNNMVKKFKPEFIKYHKTNRFGWAKEQIKKERAAGNLVVLISASPDYLIPDLVRDLRFNAILTSQMYENKPWKYKFLCYGKNKVVALFNWARDHKYIPHIVRAYSDSDSDKPIMDIADKRVWIDRKTGIRKYK